MTYLTIELYTDCLVYIYKTVVFKQIQNKKSKYLSSIPFIGERNQSNCAWDLSLTGAFFSF